MPWLMARLRLWLLFSEELELELFELPLELESSTLAPDSMNFLISSAA
jgi:hypothetical protein